MVILLVPAPSIFAPMPCKQAARSTTSGSCAAFSMAVVPFASVAAIIRFSVPVTETVSMNMCAPCNLFAVALMYPSSRSISAPIAISPSICKSTGLDPIAHPPGMDTSACPNRASNGPSTSIEARIVSTISYVARNLVTALEFTATEPLSSTSTEAPRRLSRSSAVVISFR